MMYFGGLVFLTFSLPGAARRRLRVDDSHHNAQQRNKTLTQAFEGSTRAWEAFIPSRLFGAHGAKGALNAPSGPKDVKFPPKDDEKDAPGGEFVLHHFAGPIKNAASGFVEKNTDKLPSDVAAMLATSRRDVIGRTLTGAVSLGAVAIATPALAVAPPSPQQVLKTRGVYGSRVYRLQSASAATILDEKNALTLFITGAYGATADKATKKGLEKLQKAALAAATKGDTAAAQAAIKEFVALGAITEMDTVPGSTYNAKTPCDRAGLQCGYLYEGYVGSRMKDI